MKVFIVQIVQDGQRYYDSYRTVCLDLNSALKSYLKYFHDHILDHIYTNEVEMKEAMNREKAHILNHDFEKDEWYIIKDKKNDAEESLTIHQISVTHRVWIVEFIQENHIDYQHIFHSKESAVEFIVENQKEMQSQNTLNKEKEEILKTNKKEYVCFKMNDHHFNLKQKSIH